MKDRYNIKRVHIFKKGDIFYLRIPRIDRAATDLHRLPCIVVQRVGKKHYLYKLQCEHGILNKCFPGGELEAHTGSFEVTKNRKFATRISLREAAKKSNPGNAYYGTFCSCKGNYSGKRCSCQIARKPCSTRCHSGRSCLNRRDEPCQVHSQSEVEHNETRATSHFQTKADPDLPQQARYKAKAHLPHHQIKQNPDSAHRNEALYNQVREHSPHQTCPQTEVDPVSPHCNEADTDPSRRMTLRRRLMKADVSSQQTKAPHHHTNTRQHQPGQTTLLDKQQRTQTILT